MSELTETNLEQALEEIARRAKEDGVRIVATPTHIDIRPAIAYWEANGYEPIGEVIDPDRLAEYVDLMHCAPLNKYWMKRR